MALTRRFFTALARDYRDRRPNTGEDTAAFTVWKDMVAITASALAVQNGMFNRARFFEACGMPEQDVERAAG